MFSGSNILNGKVVAIKIERITSKKRMFSLRNEAMVYKKLRGKSKFYFNI